MSKGMTMQDWVDRLRDMASRKPTSIDPDWLADDIEVMMAELNSLKAVIVFAGKTLLQADEGKDQDNG